MKRMSTPIQRALWVRVKPRRRQIRRSIQPRGTQCLRVMSAARVMAWVPRIATAVRPTDRVSLASRSEIVSGTRNVNVNVNGIRIGIGTGIGIEIGIGNGIEIGNVSDSAAYWVVAELGMRAWSTI